MPTVKVKDIVFNKDRKGTERWEVVAIEGTQARLKLLARNKETGQPVELNAPHFETVPVSALVLVDAAASQTTPELTEELLNTKRQHPQEHVLKTPKQSTAKEKNKAKTQQKAIRHDTER